MPTRIKVDPQQIGLHYTTQLEQIGENSFIIVIDRKSRIIMKDGNSILLKIEKIRQTYPRAQVDIETTAPVCSKTRVFLASHKISIFQK